MTWVGLVLRLGLINVLPKVVCNHNPLTFLLQEQRLVVFSIYVGSTLFFSENCSLVLIEYDCLWLIYVYHAAKVENFKSLYVPLEISFFDSAENFSEGINDDLF